MDLSRTPFAADALPAAEEISCSDGLHHPHAAGSDEPMVRKRLWSAEQRVQIVLESLRGKDPNRQICRRYEISEPTLYKWRQLFLEGGKAFLSGAGPATVQRIAEENQQLREMLLDLSIAYHRLRTNRSKAGEPAPATSRQNLQSRRARHLRI